MASGADLADVFEASSGRLAVPFAASAVKLQTDIGERTALVLTPTAEIVASKAPAPGKLGSIEGWVIDAARAASREESATVCIFRGRSDEDVGTYRFAEDLGNLAPVDLAERMLVAQLFVYREMVELGVCLFVHTEFGLVESEAFVEASHRLQESLRSRADGGDVEAEVDLWILQNLVFFFTIGLQRLTASTLPGSLPMMEARMERIRRKVVRTQARKRPVPPKDETRVDDQDPGGCRFQARCPMFPRFRSVSVLAIYKTLYCSSDFEKCKRYASANAGVMPDADLLPDGDRLGSLPDP